MRIAVIPARGGSKRIPRKNIKLFCGKPMLAYSIAAARDCGLFDKVIVSTDDDEIAAIAKNCGADVPFIRPAELADDYCVIADVIKHAVEWCDTALLPVESVCCIYATAPLIAANDIVRGYNVFNQPGTRWVLAVTSFPFPIQRALRVNTDDCFEMISPENQLVRSQDLEDSYHDAGQFFWQGRAMALQQHRDENSGKNRVVVIPRFRVQDIDTEEDWLNTELMYQVLEQRELTTAEAHSFILNREASQGE